MSANNQLLIKKYDDGYKIADVDIDDAGTGFFLNSEKSYPTLEAAIKAGKQYMAENEVEYGMDIVI